MKNEKRNLMKEYGYLAEEDIEHKTEKSEADCNVTCSVSGEEEKPLKEEETDEYCRFSKIIDKTLSAATASMQETVQFSDTFDQFGRHGNAFSFAGPIADISRFYNNFMTSGLGFKRRAEDEYTEMKDEMTSIVNDMKELYKKKNKAYGNSFGDTFSSFGEYKMEYAIMSALARLTDKYNRLMQLTVSNMKSAAIDDLGESIEDTLIDLANYSVMTWAEIDRMVASGPTEYLKYKPYELHEALAGMAATAVKTLAKIRIERRKKERTE